MNDNRKIVSYDPMTGAPIYEDTPELQEETNKEEIVNEAVQTINDTTVNDESVSNGEVQTDNEVNVQPQVDNQNFEQPQTFEQPQNFEQQNNNYAYGQTQTYGQDSYQNQTYSQDYNQQYYNNGYNQQQYNYGNYPQKKKSNTGLIIGIVVGVIVLLIAAAIVLSTTVLKKAKKKVEEIESNINETVDSNSNSNVTEEKKDTIFYGNGYELTIDNTKWKKETKKTTDGKEVNVLQSTDGEIILMPIGVSSLSEFKVDFSKTDGKKSLYQQFYDYWNKEKIAGEYTLTGGYGSFYLLNDKVYYTYMDYGKSTTNAGRMYIIVDVDNNIVLSFRTQISTMFYTNSSKALNVLKTIKITKKYDNEMADALNSMSAWNQNSSVRKGIKLGTKKELKGGWRKLSSSSEDYWVFNGEEFYWYKSYKDLKDNYWYGKAKIATGKEGLKLIGVDESKLDKITADSSVSANDVYGVVLTPSKIISGGKDKSDTNISGDPWNFALVIVDHGSEGLELQMLNVKTAETTYYVKIND